MIEVCISSIILLYALQNKELMSGENESLYLSWYEENAYKMRIVISLFFDVKDYIKHRFYGIFFNIS